MAYIRLLLVFLIPPVAVYMQFGFGRHFVVNVLLTLLGVVPGIVHGVYIMASQPPGLVRLEQFDAAGTTR